MEVGVERPLQPMLRQRLAGNRPDAVQLVREGESLPVVEAEVTDDALLPLGLIAGGDIGEAVGCRDRRRQALTPRHV